MLQIKYEYDMDARFKCCEFAINALSICYQSIYYGYASAASTTNCQRAIDKLSMRYERAANLPCIYYQCAIIVTLMCYKSAIDILCPPLNG